MRLWALVGFAVLAAACGTGSGAPATIERQVSGDGLVDTVGDACDDLESLALGRMENVRDLGVIVDELARIGALIGATEALPHLAELRDLIDEGSNETAHPLANAAATLDAAGQEFCQIPGFTALYVSTSFSTCFARAGIVAGGLAPETEGCETGISPEFLPCFDPDQGFLPIDCRTGEGVRLVDREWVTT